MVLGVARKELGDTFAEVLKLMGLERALVVCGKEGLDEISPEGETWVCCSVHSSKVLTKYRLGGSKKGKSRPVPFTPHATLDSPPTLFHLFEDPLLT
jgi:anthranilate phosphoribosyltransferase